MKDNDLMFIAGAVSIVMVMLLVEGVLAYCGEPRAQWLFRLLDIEL